MKNSLEGIVIKWVSSINEVLKEDSATLLINGHPNPSAEIKFWNARMSNLQNIYTQLRGDKIKSVATVLETIDSVYFMSFRTAFKNVITALVMARDITLWLNPLVNIDLSSILNNHSSLKHFRINTSNYLNQRNS